MRGYAIRTIGTESTLQPREAPVPEPGPHQLLIKVRAAGLNRGEFMGAHAGDRPDALRPAGHEGAGEVAGIGAAVQRRRIGDRVMGRCVGAFAEYALMDERDAIPVPPNLSWEQAAAIPMAFMVVYDMLFMHQRLAAGEWLLVTGISSGVGVAALQTAKALGARVVGTSGSAKKLKQLEALGLDVGLCTREADFREAVMTATQGKGVNLVVNAVGGSMFPECMRTMAFEGRLATVGYVDGVLKSEIDLDLLHAKRLTLYGVSNKQRGPEQRAPVIAAFARDVLPWFADGTIQPVIDKVFPFGEVLAAKAHMDANLHVGKIVVAVADPAGPRSTV